MTEKDFNQTCIEKLENLELIAMEECGELIQAISKAKRNKLDYQNLCEEIADVLICIEWIKQKYDVKEEHIKSWSDFKKERCLDRIERGLFN